MNFALNEQKIFKVVGPFILRLPLNLNKHCRINDIEKTMNKTSSNTTDYARVLKILKNEALESEGVVVKYIAPLYSTVS